MLVPRPYCYPVLNSVFRILFLVFSSPSAALVPRG